MHCSAGTFIRAARAAGLPPRPTGPRPLLPTCPERKRVLALRQRGVTYAAIARRLNRCKNSVCGLVMIGVPRMTGPCSVCGAPRAHRHHVSYVPEQVIGLCPACHRRAHCG